MQRSPQAWKIKRFPIKLDFAFDAKLVEPEGHAKSNARRGPMASLIYRLTEWTPPYPTAVTHGYRYGYGVEARDLRADRRIVKFCLSIWQSEHAREGRSRLLVRDGLRDLFPKSIADRTDRGDQASDWRQRMLAIRPELREWIHDFQKSDLIRGPLDLPRMRQMLDRLPELQLPAGDERIYYRDVLLRGVEIGVFPHAFENGQHKALA